MTDKNDRTPLSNVIDFQNSVWADGITSDLKSPVCSHPNQHLSSPYLINGNDNYEANWGGKGDLAVMSLESGCGAKWEICFGFHKGTTSSFVRLTQSCKPKSFVYFIEALGLDKIKIGVSDNPEKRLRQLSTGSAVKLEIIAKIPGNIEKERELHKRFDHLRLDGEWFHATKELKDYIRTF